MPSATCGKQTARDKIAWYPKHTYTALNGNQEQQRYQRQNNQVLLCVPYTLPNPLKQSNQNFALHTVFIEAATVEELSVKIELVCDWLRCAFQDLRRAPS